MPPSGDHGVTEPVRIYPATNIHRELGRADANKVLDWFRANGVSPTAVPMDDLIEITDVIDFWWYSGKEPSDPTWQTLETQAGAPLPPQSPSRPGVCPAA